MKKLLAALALALPPIVAHAGQSNPPGISTTLLGAAGGNGVAQTRLMPRYLGNGVNPPANLRTAIATVQSGGTVNVCFAGDSTGIRAPNQLPGTPASVNDEEGITPLIMRRLEDQNPGVNFVPINLSIPGQTYAALLSTSAYSSAIAYGITWWTGSGSPWYQYFNIRPCTIDVTNFGVNDGGNLQASTLASVVNDLESPNGTNPQPDIIMVTSGVANALAGGNFALPGNQAGYIAGPSLVRAFADVGQSGFTSTYTKTWPPIGTIDANEVFQETVLGKDYYHQNSTDITSTLPTTVTVSTASPYLLPQTDGDFQYQGDFVGQLSAMSTGGAGVNIVVGEMDQTYDNLAARFVITPYVNGTGGSVQFFNSSAISPSKSYSWSGSDLKFEISKKGRYMSFIVNGQTPWQQNFIVMTAPFQPQIGIIGNSSNWTLTNQQYSIGNANLYNDTLNATQAYGPSVASLQAVAAATSGNVVQLPTPLPASVAVGQPITDVPEPNSIPAGSVITAVDTNSGNVTFSGSGIVSPGVFAGDTIAIGPTTSTIGGNGINHPASWSWNNIWATAVDATNLCIICYTENGTASPSITTQTLATGATYAAPQGLIHLLETPAGTLATQTISLPPYPKDGARFDEWSTQTISAQTVNAGSAPSGTTIVGNTNPISVSPFSLHSWKYNLGLNEWIQQQ